MKATGITRQLDKLGRIVLPKELRRTLNIENEDYLEIYVEDNDKIVLRKYEPTCLFCGSKQHVVEFRGKKVCRACMREISRIEE